MKRKVKGFTLIECLVALAVLGVASLLLVQAYTQLMRVTNLNNTVATSIADQMRDAETGKNDDVTSKRISGTAVTDTYNASAGRDFILVRSDGKQLVTNVDVRCVYPYENHTQTNSPTKEGTDVRFIYFYGYPHRTT